MPPTNDFRRHYVQRNAMELRTAPPDVSDPANWDLQLLVEIPQEDGSMLDTCLQLRDAQLIHDASLEHPQGTLLSDAYALRWKLPEVTNINQGLGACFLWSSDERMCQLTPSPALQKTSRSRAHTFHDIYGELDEELSALGLVADDLVHEWEYTHNMNVLNGVSVQKRGTSMMEAPEDSRSLRDSSCVSLPPACSTMFHATLPVRLNSSWSLSRRKSSRANMTTSLASVFKSGRTCFGRFDGASLHRAAILIERRQGNRWCTRQMAGFP